MPRPVDIPALAAAVGAGERAALSRAITLVESTHPAHRAVVRDLIARLVDLGPSEPAVRVGLSGVPGVGKSTFIETLGSSLTEQGRKVGVLAVDPSSVRTGGSVLGDKTRMPHLSVDPNAYVRPSPSSGTLGGVTRATAQAILVLEAAGFDVVIVETVGVGQSEVTVAGMVDTFCFLTLARTGDQLQGIKRGILEIADVIAVNKADGEHAIAAQAAARELAGALRLVGKASPPGGGVPWVTPVLTCSGLTGVGVPELWQQVLAHRENQGAVGLAARRAEQQLALTWSLVHDELADRLRRSPEVAAIAEQIRHRVLTGSLSATVAAEELLAAYDRPRLPQG